jgi:hypothetical protein
LSIPDLNIIVPVSSGNKPSLDGETTPMFWRYSRMRRRLIVSSGISCEALGIAWRGETSTGNLGALLCDDVIDFEGDETR